MDSNGIVFGVVGLAVSIIGGGFGFLWRHIQGVAKGLREEINAVDMRGEARAVEGRTDRAAIWNELRTMERANIAAHNEVLNRISQVPTRDEFREDLRSLEARIGRIVDGVARPVGHTTRTGH